MTAEQWITVDAHRIHLIRNDIAAALIIRAIQRSETTPIDMAAIRMDAIKSANKTVEAFTSSP